MMQDEPNDYSKLPDELSVLNELPEEVRANLLGLKCLVLLAGPNGIQAIAAILAAKKAGLIRDKGHCMDVAGDAGKLGAILGGAVAGAIAGETAKCACEQVFNDGGGSGGTPPREPGPRRPDPIS
jgi:hypothetical protein